MDAQNFDSVGRLERLPNIQLPSFNIGCIFIDSRGYTRRRNVENVLEEVQ